MICDTNLLPSPVCQFTCGNWESEIDSARALDDRLEQCSQWFKTFKEVRGEYVQPRFGAKDKTARIDRVLIPSADLMSRGWNNGAIGIEIKKSGTKIGPVVAQCQDYSRAAFRMSPSCLVTICEWIFIWPLSDFAGDIASVMTQNRIGGLFGHSYVLLRFKTACGNLLTIHTDGSVEIGAVNPGRGTGHR